MEGNTKTRATSKRHRLEEDPPYFTRSVKKLMSSTKPNVTSRKSNVTSHQTTRHKRTFLFEPQNEIGTYSRVHVPRLVLGSMGSEPGQFLYPRAVIVDELNGDIYIADGGNKRICVYDKDARYKLSFNVESGEPNDLCFTANRDIAVTCGDHVVRIFDCSGNCKQTIGRHGKELGEFDTPWGIATDNDGLIYVCEQRNARVQVFDKSGSAIRVWCTNKSGKLENPRSLAIHPQTGHIYVTDRTENIEHRSCHIYNHDGQFVGRIGCKDIHGIRVFDPWYVSFSNDGLLCITDIQNHCIHLMRDGQVVQRIGLKGHAPGRFLNPLGTAFTPSKDIIVCEVFNYRLQIFSTTDKNME